MLATRYQFGPSEQTENRIIPLNQGDGMEATTRIELVYTVLQTVA